MRTLITGGAGFIGTHLVERLLASGDEVVVLDSFESQVHGDDAHRSRTVCSIVEGDVATPSSWIGR